MLPCSASLLSAGSVNPAGSTHRRVGLFRQLLLPHLQPSFSFFELLLLKAEVTF